MAGTHSHVHTHARCVSNFKKQGLSAARASGPVSRHAQREQTTTGRSAPRRVISGIGRVARQALSLSHTHVRMRTRTRTMYYARALLAVQSAHTIPELTHILTNQEAIYKIHKHMCSLTEQRITEEHTTHTYQSTHIYQHTHAHIITEQPITYTNKHIFTEQAASCTHAHLQISLPCRCTAYSQIMYACAHID